MKLLLTLIISILIPTANAEVRLTKDQKELMILAHNVWKEIGYPETGQAMLLQESSAGLFNIGDTDLGYTSYGAMQVNLPTARYVLKHSLDLKYQYFGKLSKPPVDELVITMLKHNNKFNIEVAARYFEMIRKRMKDWTSSVGAYNAGIRGYRRLSQDVKYKHVRRITKRIKKEVRPFNMKVGLHP